MNLKNKKTVLGDDAALYSHKENVSEKEKWTSMKGKKRWQYFVDYYLWKIVAAVAAVAIVGSILYTMLRPKPEVVLSAAVVEDGVNVQVYEQIQEKFHQVIGLDEKTQETVFDTTYNFSNGDYQAWQKFSMYNMVGDLDITFLPKSLFEQYAPGGYFSPVAEHLSGSLYASLSDYLLETMQEDEEGNLLPGSETVYGIDLSDTWPFAGLQREEAMVLVINRAPENAENIEVLLTLLFFPDDVN